jgi:hypothetical protein
VAGELIGINLRRGQTSGHVADGSGSLEEGTVDRGSPSRGSFRDGDPISACVPPDGTRRLGRGAPAGQNMRKPARDKPLPALTRCQFVASHPAILSSSRGRTRTYDPLINRNGESLRRSSLPKVRHPKPSWGWIAPAPLCSRAKGRTGGNRRRCRPSPLPFLDLPVQCCGGVLPFESSVAGGGATKGGTPFVARVTECRSRTPPVASCRSSSL